MLEEDEDTPQEVLDDGEADMETERVDTTSHSRLSVKNVLERKLSNRLAKQDLMDKNILCGYSTSPVLHAQTSRLEFKKTTDSLQKKIRQRPDQTELVQMNILKDTSAHPSLHANQIQLKKAVTADHLSKKIASRPGPLMLIQKGILNPADHGLVGAVKQVPLPTGEESEEMIAAEAMQQQQQKKRYQQRHSVATMGGWGAQGSSNGTTTSPFHSGEWGKLVSGNSPISRSMSADVVDDVNGESRRKGSSSSSLPSPPDFISLESPAHSPSGGSVGVRSPPTARSFPSSQINAFGRNSGKVPTVSPKLCKKQVKSKREKFRFHVYQPPNQKRNLKDVPQKQQSPYSLLVQQQQILLQLQVLQQQHPEMMNTGINFPPIPQDCSPQQHMQILLQTLSKMTAHINQDKNNQGVSSGIPTSKSSPPFVVPTSEPLPTSKDSSTLSLMGLVSNSHKGMSTSNSHYSSESVLHCDNGKTVKFEDVRVNQLKDACKEKKLVMSGKKADLIERLLEHNNGVLPASVIDRKDVGPDTNRITTPQESSSGVPTTSPVFKFPNNSDSVITSTRPSLPIKHIRKMQDKFDEVNQLKKLNYISSGRNYPGSIAPMPDTIPASFTAQQQQQQQQQQKLSNHVATTSNVANSTSSSVITNSTSRQSVSESHQPLIKKKSLSEPSSPTLSPSPSTLNLLTEMIGDNSNLLNPSVLRQQLGGVKEHFTNQQQHFNGVLPNGSSHQQQQQQQPISAANVGMGGSVVYRNNKGAPPHINQRPNRNSLPMLPPYMPTGGGGVPTAAAAMKSLQQQNNTPANASDFDFHDSGMYMRDTNHLPPGDSSELMDIGNDPNLMEMLSMEETGYQQDSHNPAATKSVPNSNLLDFLSISNPMMMGGVVKSEVPSNSPKDIPPPPYTSPGAHATASDLSWLDLVDGNTAAAASYGTSPIHNSMAYLNQNLSVSAERFNASGSEQNKSNLNNIQPYLDSELPPVPTLDLLVDTEKFLSMSHEGMI